MMELFEHDAQWFLSKPGYDAFGSAKNLEERSVFLYAYLKQVAPTDFDKDKMLFRIAFFLADAVMGSTLAYHTYPALLIPEKNPFVAYLKNVGRYPGAQTVYYVFLSILHGIAAPIRQNEWVYDKQLEDPEYLEKKLKELGKPFFASGLDMVSADDFAIEESLQQVQLKWIWLMGQL